MSAVTTARKLASIQRIKALDPIPAADAIERATILGWQLVVKRGEFAVGDLCVYCEIDALLPARPAFEFLRPRKFIVRTVRLRGQISQGICFPLAILPPGTPIAEGADVTAALGVVKYEPPLPAHFAGQAKGPLPRFIPKTDETRVQVLEEVLARHRGTTFATTEKLDGTSMTCYLRDGVFGVCSRSLDLVESAENLFWQAARRYGVEEKLRALGGNVAVQGELVGEGIQKNRLGLRGVQFFLFSIFDIDRYAFRDVAAFVTTARALDLPTVPLVDASFALADDLGVPELVQRVWYFSGVSPHDFPALSPRILPRYSERAVLVAHAVGRSALNSAVWREGLVFRPLIETTDPDLGRLSFKAINPEYLLKHGE